MIAKSLLGIVLVIFLFPSCSPEKTIYYEYNGVTVTRIHKNSESYFYYGRCNDGNIRCPSSYIKGNYSGFDGLMFGHLVFQNDKKVKMVYGEALQQVGNDSLLYLFEFKENYMYLDWHDSIKDNYSNVIRIVNVLSVEKSYNKEAKSKVKASYP